MSFIDWSDHEEMLGLLLEYVADEAATSQGDPARVAFLRTLLQRLESVAEAELESVRQIADALREIRSSQFVEFMADPVLDHLDDCMEELERIATQRAAGAV
jgi:hypothetical protein